MIAPMPTEPQGNTEPAAPPAGADAASESSPDASPGASSGAASGAASGGGAAVDRGGPWFPCPYCGKAQASGATECASCGGLFEPLSRQATQNQMGPWQIRDEAAPFIPGRSYAAVRRMAERGKITADTVLRGPTTRQFWMAAGEAPGVAHLLGRCHACKAETKADAYSCERCGAVFPAPDDRQALGLGPVRVLPGQAPPAMAARSAAGGASATAFAELARTAAARGSASPPGTTPRPSEPRPIEPRPPVVGTAASKVGFGAAPDLAGAAQDVSEAPELRRALRAAERRVSALTLAVYALAALNALVVIAALVVALRSGGPGEPPAPASDRAASQDAPAARR